MALCTRVREPDTDNYNKLVRVMLYIRDIKKLTLTVEPTDNPKWWLESSYAAHPDIKSHTRICMTIGRK